MGRTQIVVKEALDGSSKVAVNSVMDAAKDAGVPYPMMSRSLGRGGMTRGGYHYYKSVDSEPTSRLSREKSLAQVQQANSFFCQCCGHPKGKKAKVEICSDCVASVRAVTEAVKTIVDAHGHIHVH